MTRGFVSNTYRYRFYFWKQKINENVFYIVRDTSFPVIGCGVFVDLQKAFDTADHQILLTKLNHYGIREVSNDWFKSYLSNCNQYVSINGYESGLAALNWGVLKGSVLGPFCFYYI